jgi:hypothetical protein
VAPRFDPAGRLAALATSRAGRGRALLLYVGGLAVALVLGLPSVAAAAPRGCAPEPAATPPSSSEFVNYTMNTHRYLWAMCTMLMDRWEQTPVTVKDGATVALAAGSTVRLADGTEVTLADVTEGSPLPVHDATPSSATVELAADAFDPMVAAQEQTVGVLHSDLWFALGLLAVLVPAYLLARLVMPRA